MARVLSLVLTHGLQLALVGVLVGLAGAMAGTQLMGSILFRVEPTDAATLTAAAIGITSIAVIASAAPAWRASRLDPNRVLRGE